MNEMRCPLRAIASSKACHLPVNDASEGLITVLKCLYVVGEKRCCISYDTNFDAHYMNLRRKLPNKQTYVYCMEAEELCSGSGTQ